MKERLLMLTSMAILGGTATFTLDLFVASPTPVIVGMAVAPLYSLRVGLWSMPERFDFDQYSTELSKREQSIQHIAIAVPTVVLASTLGILTLEIAETFVPAVDVILAIFVSFSSSIFIGINLLLSLNDTYGVPRSE